ncbi:MAG TPA: amino acid ABC transporter permease [Burkholderiales bacterium]
MRFSPRDARFRALLYQVLALAAVVGVLAYLVTNTIANLEARKIASGFAFLSREAGFEIGETSFISYGAADNYARALLVGLANTFRVALIGVVAATVIGTFIGFARLSSNWLVAKLSSAYIEVIRNVPLLVQLFFWYAIISENLPGPRQALSPVSGVFLSNRGFAVPVIEWHAAYQWVLAAFVLALLVAWRISAWARARQARTGQQFHAFWTGLGIVVALPLLAFIAIGAPFRLIVPELAGFNFSGGATLTPEFAALLIGLVAYTAAFIAEIVRAGILSVHRGQTEAASALGLRPSFVLRLVILPQALRVIVPPLTSQYLNLTKNSSLAVAIGYPDIVSIANTAINQTGQAIEGIGIIMAVYLTISLSISAFMNWYNKRIALVER